MNRLKIAAVVLLLAAIASPAMATIDQAIIGLDIDECSIRRGPNEPSAHCGDGSGNGSGWSERQIVAEVKPAARVSGVETATWGQVKQAVLAGR
jgi:hypothetical protein